MDKKCNVCKIVKDISCFYKDNSKPSGYSYRCKDCDKIRVKNRNSYPEYHRRKQMRYRSKYPERQRSRELARAEYGSIHFDICAMCWEIKKLELHHEDYSKPLEVIAVCNSCHNKL